MNYNCLDVSVSDGIARITLNQPQRLNSMTAAFWAEIPRVFRELDEAGGTRAHRAWRADTQCQSAGMSAKCRNGMASTRAGLVFCAIT